MQIHNLKPTHKLKKKKKVGRGGKRGTYSGRGMKGQKSRAGRKMEPAVRGLIKKYPKLRGYKFKAKDKDTAIINIEVLERNFKEGEKVDPKTLLKKRLIRRIKGKTPKVKILGKGEITKKFIIENCEVSKAAKETVGKAGGIIKSKIKN